MTAGQRREVSRRGEHMFGGPLFSWGGTHASSSIPVSGHAGRACLRRDDDTGGLGELDLVDANCDRVGVPVVLDRGERPYSG
jgi:hypothetical protein